MRVLAVAQVARCPPKPARPPGTAPSFTDTPLIVATTMASNSAVCANALRISSKRKSSDGPPVAAELLEHARVVRRIDDDEHVAEVLGGGAEQARAADVDLLDQLRRTGVGVGGRLGERIEVHDDEVDRRDAVPADRLEVVRAVATRQDAAVDRRVQRLDPPVHHLGKPGDVGDVDDRETLGGQRLGGAAGGHQFDPKGGQAAAERRQPGLVGNTQNCTHIFTIC